MKKRTRAVMLSIGVIGAAVIVLAIALAIVEGYVSDATHRVGSLAPYALMFLVGACIALLGFGSLLFRRE
ncbi:hypothetical protein [Microbacterium sp. W4I20]|uniref:hypothetical protein n=1 Tax=Microbacterium sp. W4I20 TaxID=3042262 RepID=UPI00278A3130|nr:hypothetical protein [Microbacterium sp. W4I20]MDQ0727280.1 hypothetical protein [Microbacterium sp. W4I20]